MSPAVTGDCSDNAPSEDVELVVLCIVNHYPLTNLLFSNAYILSDIVAETGDSRNTCPKSVACCYRSGLSIPVVVETELELSSIGKLQYRADPETASGRETRSCRYL